MAFLWYDMDSSTILTVRGDSMKIKVLALLMVLALSVSGFIAVSDGYDADDATPTVSEVNLYKLAAETPIKVALRYYDDMPNVPYIGVCQLYNIYQDKIMTIAPDNDGKYIAKNDEGSAVFDLNKGTIYSEDYRSFSQMSMGEATDNPSYMKLLDYETTGSKAATLNYSDYNIKAYYSDGEIYMPLSIVADVFMGTAGFMIMYVPGTSESIPSMHMINSLLLSDTSKVTNPQYIGALEAYIKSGERTDDMARFSYDNLCFYLDNFYGDVSSSSIGGQMKSKTLNQILTESNDINLNQVRAWLQSTSIAEYFAGLISLETYLYDGGHTSLDAMVNYVLRSSASQELRKAVETELKKVELPSHMDKDTKSNDIMMARDSTWAGATSLGGGDKYYQEGDTAVFSFDHFVADDDAWKAYVPGSSDYPDDSIGHFVKALNMAKANPEIRNFVIDLSTNTGGMVSVVSFIMAMMTGDYATSREFDVQTGATYIARYHVDTNLDGKFDKEDLKKQYEFNFALLTTNLSFSSGNMLPVYAKDDGIMIIGERSGGGVCSIMLGSTADGFFGTYSSYMSTATKSGADVEAGAAPDKVLIDSSTTDYSVLFDMDVLSSAINDFYKKTDNTALYVAIAIIVIGLIVALALFLKRRSTA